MQMNGRFYLITRNKEFSNHFFSSLFLIAEVNPTQFLVSFRLRIMD